MRVGQAVKVEGTDQRDVIASATKMFISRWNMNPRDAGDGSVAVRQAITVGAAERQGRMR